MNSTAHQQTTKTHPLNNKSFFAIPRTIAMLTDVSDGLYRLLSVLYGSYGSDGVLMFKIDTLCRLMGGKGYSTVKRIIKQGRGRFYNTTFNGRSIEFNIIDSGSKVSHQVAQKRATSYKEQKKLLKETTTAPAAPATAESQPKHQADNKTNLVVADFKNLLRADLKPQFNFRTYHILKRKKLTDGQIKGLIDEINGKPDKRSVGWIIAKVSAVDSIAEIPDKDKAAKAKLDAELKRKAKAVKAKLDAEQAAKDSIKNAISPQKMREATLKRRGLWKRHKELEAKEKPLVDSSFELCKQRFFAHLVKTFGSDTDHIITARFTRLNDIKLRACNEFKNFCQTQGFRCV